MNKLLVAAAAISLGSVISASAADVQAPTEGWYAANILALTEGWYAEASAGVSLGELKAKAFGGSISDDATSFIGRINFGKSLIENVRVGVEGAYSPAYSESYDFGVGSAQLDINVWSVIAVAYYDFNNKTRFTPFVGAGAGIGVVDFELCVNGDLSHFHPLLVGSQSETTTHPALKLAAGVALEVSKNVGIIADYNFNYFTNAVLADPIEISGTQNTFNLGLRYSF
ncbi:hypothetical protein GCM10007094_14800 [Pseudovibrio japonicus]|uniref:Outer membrane protein beta-barrel domain-containing protein n=1 Tax=Pseudovibrio japonicus TaxID=366534 RepID=A0ABQ3E5V0_9HYPH|nr:outer membrane beta-barrel protein [Pseudovibrio japonicus]GHB27512.1 hypothetical protein GCM10007094_14800 [Pseudovibrio japonicus]